MLTFIKILAVCLFVYHIQCQCKGNQVLFAGQCVSDCPPNYILVREGPETRCQLCAVEKFEIPDKQQKQCVCALRFYREQLSGGCQQCHPSCLECRGPSANDCTTCESEEFITNRVKKGRNCVCIQGFYENILSKNCQRCHPDCKTCSGGEDTQCEICSEGRIRDDLGNCICSSNFIVLADGTCGCPSPYVLSSSGACVQQNSQCGPNQVPKSSSTPADKGKGKGKGNQVQLVSEQVQCECRAGFVKVKGTCKVCGKFEQYNPQNRRCQCIKEAVKTNNGCIFCPKEKIFNRRTGQCSCKKNQQQLSNGECIRCAPKQIVINDKCDCIANYYRGRNGRCTKCKSINDNERCTVVHHGSDKEIRLQLKEV